MSAALLFAQPAQAQSRSLTEGPVVRRMLLFRSGKFELTPTFGTSFGNVYQREYFIGVGGTYHLSNSFAIGLHTALAPIPFDSTVTSNLEEAAPEQYDRLTVSHQFMLVDLMLSYIPLHGKLNLFGSTIFHYDVNLNVGVGGALVSSDADDLSGFNFGPAFGLGMRLFFKDNMALTLAVTDYFYSGSEAVRDEEQTEPTSRGNHHFVGTVGLGIFFPSEVRVSR